MNHLIYALYFGNFLFNAANSFISSFFPQKVEQQFRVGEAQIGLIFSFHPVGFIICSLLLAKTLSKGEVRKVVTILGTLAAIVGLFGFIIVDYINQKEQFLAVAIISRITLGIGQSLFCTPAYAYIPLLYNSTIEEKSGWMDGWGVVGLMIGPLLGSTLFKYGGYVAPFLFFVSSFTLLIPVLIMQIPEDKQLEYQIEKQDGSLKQSKRQDQIENDILNYSSILRDKHIILNCLAIFLPVCGLLFLDPTMGIHLKQLYNLDEIQVGLIFSIGPLVYLALSPFSYDQIIKFLNYEVLFFVGLLINGISFFFFGPEKYTFLPQRLYITCIGNCLTGVSCIFIYFPALSQLNRLLKRLSPQESKEVVGDVASALYNTSQALGELLGSIIGGVFSEYFTFSRGASIFGIIILLFSIVYAILTRLKHDRIQEKKEEEFSKNSNCLYDENKNMTSCKNSYFELDFQDKSQQIFNLNRKSEQDQQIEFNKPSLP